MRTLPTIKARHEAFRAFAPGTGLLLNAGLPQPVAEFLEHADADVAWLIAEVEQLRIDNQQIWLQFGRVNAQLENHTITAIMRAATSSGVPVERKDIQP